MILYEGTMEKFSSDVMQNCIADRAAEKYMAHYHRRPVDSEYRSWAYSLAILNNSFQYAGLKDSHVVVEYELPYSSKRIDVLVFGTNDKNEDSIVLMELKQWSNNNVEDSDSEGNVFVNYGTHKEERPHPSLQVEGYHFGLKDFLTVFSENDAPSLDSCTYAHNYSNEKDAVLYLPKFEKALESFPIFAKEDAIKLGGFLKERLQGGKGQFVFERFAASPVKPSKKLLDHTSDMINKQQIFNLIDDQIAAYNAIITKAKKISKTKIKSIIIVKGGPGTGKSVIALEVMGELMRKGQTVFHATGGKAFTETLRKIVGSRAKNLFKYFNSFLRTKNNEIDVLICDEAHRIRETSNSRYTPAAMRSNAPQIFELLNVAKLSIFFIDEYQVVRPNEIGSVDLIKEAAKGFDIADSDISEFELKTQFRCSGSDAYLQWLDNALGIRESDIAELDSKMEFKIIDTPQDLKKVIDQKNSEKENCARLVAGFCWPWSEPRRDGTLVNDVKIDDFEMPWEHKTDFWKWATDKSGMDQVGTVYTAQGFEFDYIGVIFGKDLVYRKDKGWQALPENSCDSMVKKNNNELEKHLKHVYRVLMSRAHRGVFVYFMDKETEAYFKGLMKKS